MLVRILDAAERDIEDGYYFYERQSPGLGSYFLDSLYSDIDSLSYYGGIHKIVYGYRRLLSCWIRKRLMDSYGDREKPHAPPAHLSTGS